MEPSSPLPYRDHQRAKRAAIGVAHLSKSFHRSNYSTADWCSRHARRLQGKAHCQLRLGRSKCRVDSRNTSLLWGSTMRLAGRHCKLAVLKLEHPAACSRYLALALASETERFQRERKAIAIEMKPWAIILTSWDGPAWRSGVRPTFLHFPGTDTALFKAPPISVLVRATCAERASRMMRLSALHTRLSRWGVSGGAAQPTWYGGTGPNVCYTAHARRDCFIWAE